MASLDIGEQQLVVKKQTQQRRSLRFKDRVTGEKRIKPIIKPQLIEDDDELVGIDLRRVTRLRDLE